MGTFSFVCREWNTRNDFKRERVEKKLPTQINKDNSIPNWKDSFWCFAAVLLLIADNSKSNDIAEKRFFLVFRFFPSFFTLLVSKHRIYRYIYYGFRNLTSTCFHLYFRSLSHLAYIFNLIYQRAREKCMHRTYHCRHR